MLVTRCLHPVILGSLPLKNGLLLLERCPALERSVTSPEAADDDSSSSGMSGFEREDNPQQGWKSWDHEGVWQGFGL